MSKESENRGNFSNEETFQKKQVILAALARAMGEEQYDVTDSSDSNEVYYTLSSEDVQALISGDLVKIEKWISNLDRRRATWLFRRFINENW